MKKLPTGIQDFEYLRVNDYVYVDKTEFIYKSLQGGKSLFLGRPRRFVKSLFLSTLKYYFLGRKDLFKGLYIEQAEKEWLTYPVLHIDMNVGDFADGNSVNDRIGVILDGYEKQLNITS